MSPEGVLFVLIQLALLANWPVALILGWAAYRRPRITALTVMAVATFLISVGITAYVFSVANAAAGYIVPREGAQFIFRLVLLGLALFPLWFLWLFLTGQFRDPDSVSDDDLNDAARERGKASEGGWVEIDHSPTGAPTPVHDLNGDAAPASADADEPTSPLPRP